MEEVKHHATFAEITWENSLRLTISVPEVQDSTEDP
jgi:hypothetical protein